MEMEPDEQPRDGEWFSALLDRLREQADATIAEFRAQDPATIDLVGRVGSLPGKVLDALKEMKDQLNDDSRAAIDEWDEAANQRHLEMFGNVEGLSGLRLAMLDVQESPLQARMSAWEDQRSPLYKAMSGVEESPHARRAREWYEAESERHRQLWEKLERTEQLFRESLPPNWNSPDVEFPTWEELEVLQLEEGLPLAWVPPNHVLREILACKTSASRRRLLAKEHEAILKACLSELRQLDSEETKEWRDSARQAALAMKAGHWRAGQALAAIALDTATIEFIQSSYPDAVSQRRRAKGGLWVSTPPGSGERSLPTWREIDYPRALLVLHSIYGAFGTYNPAEDEPVPIKFTRHGTVHSVSSRQYSKANALIALMHIVSLLCLIEDEQPTR